MAFEDYSIGTTAGDGTGTPHRTIFQRVRNMLTELYSITGNKVDKNSTDRLITSAEGTKIANTPTNTEMATAIAAAKTQLLNGAGAAYDTFKELQDILTADDSAIAAINTALGNRPLTTDMTAAITASFAVNTYYISPTGSDTTGDGSQNNPWATITKAYTVVVPGDIIYMRGGTYAIAANQSQGISITGKSGVSGKMIKIWNFPGEVPVIDCVNMVNGYNSLSGVEVGGSYLHIKGIEVKNLPQHLAANGQGLYGVGFSISNCNYCIFENLNIHDNQSIGINMGNSCTTNLVLNCDSHHNYDPYTYLSGSAAPGQNADGFHITLTNAGAVNILRGCRSWWNSDDAYDTFDTEGFVIFDNCHGFWNGYLPGTFTAAGDGMGFKLGRTTAANDGAYHRIVKNCLTFENRMHGIDKSDCTQNIKLINNISYANAGAGLSMNNTNANYIVNNISLGHGSNYYIGANGTNTNNSWNMSAVTIANEFVSTSSLGMDGKRQDDGSLPVTTFLKLLPSSVYINAGIDVGLPFLGTYPDCGAFESNPNVHNYFLGALTDTTPTAAEIIAILGTAASRGKGFKASIKDTSGTALVYSCESDGTDWYYKITTKAV
jgi:hypothetical protein